jgi:subtilisin family serine protease
MDFAAEALYYAADNGAKFANASWSSSNSGGISAAIDYFIAGGGILVKSAGNSDNENTDYITGRSQAEIEIISVAATDPDDCKADFSSYGTWVDIAAPGTGIPGTGIVSLYHLHGDPANDYTASISGTSMSSPLALSVAALIWSQNPEWSAEQIALKLLDSADPIDNLGCNSSYIGKLGAGRVNAFQAVISGDFDRDGDVDGSDLAAFLNAYTAGTPEADLNFDGSVNMEDLGLFSRYFGI